MGLLFAGPKGQRLSVRVCLWSQHQTVTCGGYPRGFACPLGVKPYFRISFSSSRLWRGRPWRLAMRRRVRGRRVLPLAILSGGKGWAAVHQICLGSPWSRGDTPRVRKVQPLELQVEDGDDYRRAAAGRPAPLAHRYVLLACTVPPSSLL
jgi:hypothetical protein